MKPCVITTFFVLAIFLQAQTIDSQSPCLDKAMTQADMDKCANQEVKRVDRESAALYQEILSSQGARVPGAKEKVSAMEKLWIEYRHAYIEATFPAENKNDYGSVLPMEADYIYAGLTEKHNADLKDLLQQYEGHGVPGPGPTGPEGRNLR